MQNCGSTLFSSSVRASRVVFFLITTCLIFMLGFRAMAQTPSNEPLPELESLPGDTGGKLPEGVKVEKSSEAPAQDVLTQDPALATQSEATPIDQARSLAPKGDTRLYKIPLLFSPEDNKIGLRSPQIKWNFNEGRVINFGGLIVNSDRIAFRASQAQRTTSGFFGNKVRQISTISFEWPEAMVKSGRIDIFGRDGKSIWSQEVSEKDIVKWKRPLRAKGKIPLEEHRSSLYGLDDIDKSRYPFLKDGTVFKFCLTNTTKEGEKIRICSGLYMVRSTDKELKALAAKPTSKPSVFVEKIDVGDNGIVNFPSGKFINMTIRFSSDARIEFRTRPAAITLLDMVESSDGKQIILMGRGTKPVGKVKDLVIPGKSFWSETGLGKEVVWQTIVPREFPLVRVVGAWNIPFTYLFKYEQIPNEDDRVFVSSRTGEGTYIDGTAVMTYSPSGDTLTSSENSVQRLNANEFKWLFKASEKNKLNHSRITVSKANNPERKWIAHYELYRTNANEASVRLTGLIDVNLRMVLLGEIQAGHWFEKIPFSDNYYLSKQRWGITGKYYRSLASIATESGAIDVFNSLNVDLRYNIIPGLWNRNELLGGIFSLQRLEYTQSLTNEDGSTTQYVFDSNLVGIGAYWARTMPKVFDDIFNFVWLLRYPKYVDVEFIYYPLSLTSTIAPNLTYALNFHGKVFWSKQFYGEAGFSVRSLKVSIQDGSDKNGSSPDTDFASGTFGVGYLF